MIIRYYLQFFKKGFQQNGLYSCRCLCTAYWHSKRKEPAEIQLYLDEIPISNIRNFCIIAHVDHGKSTLADRMLEYTGTIQKSGGNKQVLDKLQVERERGITVKAQTSSMFWDREEDRYLLNLIDTPGHVDFNYEVSRSLAACQGALLVVDAAQGVQAQTIANFNSATEAGLTVIPVLNKIDLAVADPDKVAGQVESLFGYPSEICLRVSAKQGIGIQETLETICGDVPCPPSGDCSGCLALFLFDSWYDRYKGIICLVAVNGGTLKKGAKLTSVYNSVEFFDVTEIGIMNPEMVQTSKLTAGQVGYVIMGMKNVRQALVGDTFHSVNDPPLSTRAGFKQPTPMVFAGIYPANQDGYPNLRKALEKLTLNDSSVSLHRDNSVALGNGWRIGFLGLLHMEVFNQRLLQEYDMDVIVTCPNVPYKAILKDGETELEIRNPTDFPDRVKVDRYLEPMVKGTLVFPNEYLGKLMKICEGKRGIHLDLAYIDQSRIIMKYRLPLNEIIVDFFDELKAATSGYASFDYVDDGYEETQIEKLDILLNGKQVDSLSTIVNKMHLLQVGKTYAAKLKHEIPRQLFEIIIQASVQGKAIAREEIKPLRKDVTAKLYGGDMTRRKKLLDQQKEGKKKMKKFGRVEVPHTAFLALLKR